MHAGLEDVEQVGDAGEAPDAAIQADPPEHQALRDQHQRDLGRPQRQRRRIGAASRSGTDAGRSRHSQTMHRSCSDHRRARQSDADRVPSRPSFPVLSSRSLDWSCRNRNHAHRRRQIPRQQRRPCISDQRPCLVSQHDRDRQPASTPHRPVSPARALPFAAPSADRHAAYVAPPALAAQHARSKCQRRRRPGTPTAATAAQRPRASRPVQRQPRPAAPPAQSRAPRCRRRRGKSAPVGKLNGRKPRQAASQRQRQPAPRRRCRRARAYASATSTAWLAAMPSMPSMKFQMLTSTMASTNASDAPARRCRRARQTPSARTAAATRMHRQPQPWRQRPMVVDPADPGDQHQADASSASSSDSVPASPAASHAIATSNAIDDRDAAAARRRRRHGCAARRAGRPGRDAAHSAAPARCRPAPMHEMQPSSHASQAPCTHQTTA